MRLNILSGVVLGIVCLGLVGGCANKGKHKDGKSKNGEDSAMMQGVGESTEFADRGFGDNSMANANDKNTYLFAFDRFDVAQHDQASIEAHADYLVKHPGKKIYINGHTDERGSREYNVALGERRAKAVTNILISRGVSPQQIKVVSYGAEKPAMQGNDESAYSQNRRAQAIYE